MAVKKIVIRPEGTNDYADELHPKTSASQVVEETDKKFMTDAERTKLAGIATAANNYTHPTGAGNNHIPTGGSTGKILGYGGTSGIASWIDMPASGMYHSSGSSYLSDSIHAGVTVTKNISIGAGKTYAYAVLPGGGYVWHITSDINTALGMNNGVSFRTRFYAIDGAVGHRSGSTDYGVVFASDILLVSAQIISGSTLRLIFKNSATETKSLDVTVYWGAF